jgi:hypothetical protein
MVNGPEQRVVQRPQVSSRLGFVSLMLHGLPHARQQIEDARSRYSGHDERWSSGIDRPRQQRVADQRMGNGQSTPRHPNGRVGRAFTAASFPSPAFEVLESSVEPPRPHVEHNEPLVGAPNRRDQRCAMPFAGDPRLLPIEQRHRVVEILCAGG